MRLLLIDKHPPGSGLNLEAKLTGEGKDSEVVLDRVRKADEFHSTSGADYQAIVVYEDNPDDALQWIQLVRQKLEAPLLVVLKHSSVEFIQQLIQEGASEVVLVGELASQGLRFYIQKALAVDKKQRLKVVPGDLPYERIIAEYTSDLISLTDFQGNFLYLSPSVYTILGFTTEEYLQFDFLDRVHPKDQAAIQEAMEGFGSGQNKIKTTFRVKAKSGNYLWLETYTRVIEQQGQKLLLGQSRDITYERERELKLERAFHESKRLSRQLRSELESLDQHAIIATTDLNGRFTYVNPKFCATTGYTLEEMIGTPSSILRSNHHTASYYENLKNTISKGRMWRGEICNKTKNNQSYWVETTIVPQLDDGGELVGYVYVQTDISDRKRAELAVKEKETSLKNLIDSTNHEIYAVDRNYRLINFNAAFRENFKKLFGITVGPGTDLTNVVEGREDLRRTWKKRYDTALEGGKISTYDTYTDLQGRERYLNVKVNPLKNYLGIITGASVYVEDITEMRRSQQLLKTSEMRLNRAQEIANIGDWTWNLENDELSWSEQLYRIYNRNPSTTSPSVEELKNIFTHDSWRALMEAQDKALEKGRDFVLELQLSGSEERYVRIFGIPQRNQDGDIDRMVGTVQDITELNVARQNEKYQLDIMNMLANTGEDLLRTSEESQVHNLIAQKAGNLLEGQELVLSLSYNQKYTRYTVQALQAAPNASELLGPGASFTGRSTDINGASSLFPYEERNQLIELDNPFELIGALLGADANANFRKTFPMARIHALPYSIDDVHLGSLFIGDLYGQDHTVLQPALQSLVSQSATAIRNIRNLNRLKSSEARLNRAQKIARMGDWEYNVEDGEIVWSPTLYSIYDRDYEAGPPTVEELLEMHAEEDRDFLRTALRAALEKGESYDLELRRNDSYRHVRALGTPIFNEKGRIEKIAGIAHDITEEKEAQQRQQKQQAQLELLARAGYELLEFDKPEDVHRYLVRTCFQTFEQEVSCFSVSYHNNNKHYVIEELQSNEELSALAPYLTQHLGKFVKRQFVEDFEHRIERGSLFKIWDLEKFKDQIISDELLQKFQKQYPEYKVAAVGYNQSNQTLGALYFLGREGALQMMDSSLVETLANQAASVLHSLHNQKAVQESQQLLDQALASAKAGTWQMDLERKEITVDNRWLEIMQLDATMHKFHFNKLIDIIHPDDQETFKSVLDGSIAKDIDIFKVELRFFMERTGKYRWFEKSGKVVSRNSAGKPTKMVGTRVDIHQRKDREEQLLLLESVITNANDAVLITSYDSSREEPHEIIYANPAFYEISGYSPDEVIGENPRFLQGEGTSEEARRKLREAVNNAKSVKTEILNYTKDGKPYWLDLNIAPVFDEKREVSHFIAIERDVTEAKEKQRELEETLMRFRMATETNDIGIWDLNLKDQTLQWDDHMLNLYGTTKAEFTGKYEDWELWIHPEDRAQAMEDFTGAIESGEEFRSRFRIIRPNKEVRHLAAIGQVSYDEFGKAQRMVGLNWDITTMVEYEEALREEVAERESILNSVSDGFTAVDQNWNITYWNKAAEKILHLKAYDMIGQNLWKVFESEIGSKFYSTYHRAMAENIVLDTVDFYEELGLWIEATAYPRENGLAIFFRDITKRVERERALEQLKLNREALINSTRDLIWSVDPKFRLISANQSFEEDYRKKTGKIPERGKKLLTKDLDPAYRKRWQELYERALKGEEFNITLENAGDQNSVENVSFYPIRENEAITGVACYSRDVTERIQHLNAIEEQNKKLKDIAWSQSHLVRAPLSNILGLANIVKNEKDRVDEDLQELLTALEKSATDLDEVIHAITDKSSTVDWDYRNRKE